MSSMPATPRQPAPPRPPIGHGGQTVGDILLGLAGRAATPAAEPAGDGATDRGLAASQALASSPAERDAVADTLAAALRAEQPAVDAVAAAGTASIVLASLLARRLGVPMVYLRPRPKGHGKQRQVEGTLPTGARVALVVDVVENPAGLEETAEVVAQHGGQVTACACLFAVADGTEAALAARDIRLVEAARLELQAPDGAAAATQAREAEPPAPRPQPPAPADVVARLQDNGACVANVLLDIGAVTINRANPFTYVSGLRSPIYTDNRLLISNPVRWQTIIAAFVDLLTYQVGLDTFDVLAGTATAGMPHAALLADRLRLPMVYVEAGGPESAGRIGGLIAPGQRALMVEDHLTTGKSVLAAANVLRAAGAVVETCISIFTYLPPRPDARTGAPYLPDIEGLRTYPLCDVRTLLDVAVQRGTIRDEDRQAVIDWLADPQGWSARHQPDAPAAP